MILLSRLLNVGSSSFRTGVRRSVFDFSKRTGPRKKPPLSSRERQESTILYMISLAVATAGASYAAVPLYRMFCSSTGYGGTVKSGHEASDRVESMKRVEDRVLKIVFNADTAAQMQWNFRPQQREIVLTPGETALAFYTAKNPTSKPIIGISSYNVVPFAAGAYFNKIQCFCFEEQILNPNEEVDMPVFFYIDPEFNEDPEMEKVNTIVLSYTFFEAKPGMTIPGLASNVKPAQKAY